jgi:hypothetical protein
MLGIGALIIAAVAMGCVPDDPAAGTIPDPSPTSAPTADETAVPEESPRSDPSPVQTSVEPQTTEPSEPAPFPTIPCPVPTFDYPVPDPFPEELCPDIPLPEMPEIPTPGTENPTKPPQHGELWSCSDPYESTDDEEYERGRCNQAAIGMCADSVLPTPTLTVIQDGESTGRHVADVPRGTRVDIWGGFNLVGSAGCGAVLNHFSFEVEAWPCMNHPAPVVSQPVLVMPNAIMPVVYTFEVPDDCAIDMTSEGKGTYLKVLLTHGADRDHGGSAGMNVE